jgi:hypothetical protein
MTSHHGLERHNSATRSVYRWAERQREFRGVDGEGGNVAEEGTLFGVRHQYLSLRAGPDLLETGKPLDWTECLGFLADLDPAYIYVGFFFDYDVSMIIRTMPEERARRLLYPGKREGGGGFALPVDVGDFQIDYLPHKEFKVRRKGTQRWIVISDVGQFFQSSFLKAITTWDIGTEEERAFIARGKAMRSEFAEFTDETRTYNALECLLLEQLMTNFRAVCEETGYVPRKWQGPGNLASAMLTKHNVPRRDEIDILRNESFFALAQSAYYGGRFETTASGPIRGPVYQYDINGAYVALLRGLPCLQHGTWRRVLDLPDRGNIWFGKVHFSHATDKLHSLCGLPVRLSNGNIQYPREATGVYWGCELESAMAAGTRIEFIEGWLYERHCDCRWFDFVDSYYAQRLRLGKSAKGYVLKLAGNSVYGKLAQSVGYAPWANPVWAGLITAGCRAQLIDAYAQEPDSCVMLATDGLFMTKPLTLPVSKLLGEWEETVHPDGIFIVQPGIYFTGSEAKSRGVERGRISDMRPVFEQQWQKFHDSGGLDFTVAVEVDNFITAKQAAQRNKWKLAGTWEKDWREISFGWGNKRKPGLGWDTDVGFRSYPYNGGPDLESVPYDRMIGGNMRHPENRYTDISLQELERMEQQPDWNEPLFSRD